MANQRVNEGRTKPIWHFWECNRCHNAPTEETRQQLLTAAFDEIHRVGFQSASLSRILERAGVTKGALYHYFPNKKALGYAVLDELILDRMRELWIEPLQEGNPIDAIVGTITSAGSQMTLEDIQLGCPLANLSQEMSPVDEGFRQRLDAIYGEWRSGLAQALERGKAAGQVRTDVDSEATAVMVVATLEGCLATAKNAQSRELLIQCGSALIKFLDSLREKENKP